MIEQTTVTPYHNNLLIEGLGPILNRDMAYQHLHYLPEPPMDIVHIPRYERMHHLMSVLDFRIPSIEGARICESIDLMLRQSYRYRNPVNSVTWSNITNPISRPHLRSPAMATAIAGHSGTGKTQTIIRSLGQYPIQVIKHDSFPQIVGEHYQVVWLSIDIPPSGKSADLAAELMSAWDRAISQYYPEYKNRFDLILSKDWRDGTKMLAEWLQVARTGFLGVLHLDEIQNLFKLATLKARRKGNTSTSPPELSIVEDKTLKWILQLLNTWQIPVIFSGTPDGIGALTKRLSTTQRIAIGGYHKLVPFKSYDSKDFSEVFLSQLLRYQYVETPLKDSVELRQLIIELTGGIQRIIIALWIAAHRVAFERDDDNLTLNDFRIAATTYLAPLIPAVKALNSGDPSLMMRYDDLYPRDDAVWASFWS